MCVFLIAAMDKNTTYYETLISKYLSGEASAKEVDQILEWLKDDSGNLRMFMDLRKSWLIQQKHYVEQIVDINDEWLSISERVSASKKVGKWLNEIDTDETEEYPINKEDDPEIITRTFWKRSHRYFTGAAAIILLLVIPTLSYFLYFMHPKKQTLFADNQVIESTLPDGTRIALNTGSILYYPSLFKGEERKVSLDGEAFFDVTHNENNAFVIVAEEMQIRVLGTSFYVNTHTVENTMEVALISGSLELSYNKHEMLLEPGDKAIILKKTGEILRQEINDPNLLAWKTHTLYFNDTPIHEIIDVLEKVYHKKITVINPEINNCRITATFEGQSLEAVLMVLQSTIDIKARPNGNRIELSGTGCQ